MNSSIKEHWNNTYKSKPAEQLGWYETDLSSSFELITKTEIDTAARILTIGAGSTTLVDALVEKGYSNIIAHDISEVALKLLSERIGNNDVLECIVDDLTTPIALKQIEAIDLWIDRAVLHFLTEEKDINTYFQLLDETLKSKGFAFFAEFALDGAKKCSGLPVKQYSVAMLNEKLGSNYRLIHSFDYNYTMPSGNKRPYIYALFQKK